MSRVCAVPHDYDVVHDPRFAADHGEATPHRSVSDNRMSIQQLFVEFCYVRDGFLFRRVFHPGFVPCIVRGFDDHGAHFTIVLISV